MTSSYNAPFSFGPSPGFGTGWTNLSEYLNQSNLNAVSGLKEEPLWDPANPDSNYQQMNAADFDSWLFKNKYPTGVAPSSAAYSPPVDTGTGNTGIPTTPDPGASRPERPYPADRIPAWQPGRGPRYYPR